MRQYQQDSDCDGSVADSLRVEKWILSVEYVSSEHVMQSEALVYPHDT